MKKTINFFYENEMGEILQVHVGEQFPKYPIYDVNFNERSSKTKLLSGKKNLLWTHNNEWIRIPSVEGLLDGYPSIDLNYVIAIYKSTNSEFKAPANAIVYNLDGTIHKVLNIPVLHSENILEKIANNKESNPPVESASFEGGLYFSGFDWKRLEDGRLVNRIQIIYEMDWIEFRELDPETGEIGSYLGQGRL